MRRAVYLLWLLVLGGCHLLFPFGASDGPANPDAPPANHDALPANHDAPSWSPKLDVLAPDGGGWIEVYNLPLPACPETAPKKLVLVPQVQGCKIAGSLGCEDSGGNFAGWKIYPPIPYRHVLGFASGFQWNSTDAFSVQKEKDLTLDDAYVEGVSITHGEPRQHIWTYVAGLMRSGGNSCPCWGGRRPPAFVGESYTCDSGNYTNHWTDVWYPAPLWDDDSAGVVGPSGDLGPGGCKPPEHPGWFEVTLPVETSDPIEVRILFDSCDENVALTALKLWVRQDPPPPDLGAPDLDAYPPSDLDAYPAADLDAHPAADLDASPADQSMQ